MDHEKRIIRYLDGEMQDEELLLFEQEMEKDGEFASQVEEIRRLQDLAAKALAGSDPETELDEKVRTEIRDAVLNFKDRRPGTDKLPGDFSNQVQEAAADYFQKPSGTMLRLTLTWYSIAAVLIVGGLLSILLRPFARMSPAEIYADYAGIYYKTESITELTRSDDDFLFAVEVFESRDYERAVVLFRILADSIPTKDYALLYLGHSYMGLNQTDMAQDCYEKLNEIAKGILLYDARWYLSLCYLRKENPEMAIELLEEISSSGSPYQRDSKKILRSIR